MQPSVSATGPDSVIRFPNIKIPTFHLWCKHLSVVGKITDLPTKKERKKDGIFCWTQISFHMQLVVGFFLGCENLGKMFDNLFHACAFFCFCFVLF